jgi:DNA-binding NarL/FixJ family response regulator
MILRLLSTGLTNKDIARQLDISLSTAKSHVHNILAKLNLRSRSQLAARMGRGLIEDFRA